MKVPEEEACEAEDAQEETEESKPVDNPKAVIGAVLFSVGNSVEYKKLANVLGRDVDETRSLVNELKAEYDGNDDCGFTIIELEGSVQMCSKASMYEHLIKIAKVPKAYSLTDSMLETLSIIAYKQPVTKLEIEKIRGVSSDHAVNRLMEYGLVTELGRLQAPGRPLLFGTTEEFLRSFNVTSLDDLPTASPDRIEEFKKEAAEEAEVTLGI
ncbi:MAG: SMC-Scp complex subunit ScpB [Lachnospiraceae bacterium]|nr:SMC-Scp complex subunit ScpB [Lachnospiraceae bacterium]